MTESADDPPPFLKPDDGSPRLPAAGRDEFGLTPGQRRKVERGVVLGRGASWIARDTDMPVAVIERVIQQLGLETEGGSERGASLPAIRGEALLPWMKQTAEWEACQPRVATRGQVRVVASVLAGVRVSERGIRLLRARPDYAAHRDRIAGDVVLRERKKLEARLPEYIDAHHAALGMAVGEKDYEAIGRISEPMVDRVWPRKEDRPLSATIIQINLGGKTIEEVREGEVSDIEVVEVKALKPE